MTDPDRTSALRARAERVRSEMGGVEKVAKMSDEGDRTIRQHIDSFLDDDSFREIGTFSRSLRVEEREKDARRRKNRRAWDREQPSCRSLR